MKVCSDDRAPRGQPASCQVGLLAVVVVVSGACGGEELLDSGPPAAGSSGDGAGTLAAAGRDGVAADRGSAGYVYSACEDPETDLGGFSAGMEDPGEGLEPYSAVSGLVKDGIVWGLNPEPLMTLGDCTLVRGRMAFCDPDCAPGENCNRDGQCVPNPVPQNLGSVEIAGLKDGPLSMEPRAPRFNYAAVGSLSYPAFDEGTPITLSATGGGAEPFTLVAEGVAALALNEAEVALEEGQPAMVTWNAPAQPGRSRVLAELNISLHGGDPLRILCDTDDDGSLVIPSGLVSELLAINYSGFPAIGVTRQTAGSVQLPWGCADFRVYSNIERHPVSIPGLTSCNEGMPNCPAGLSCNTNLMRCE